MMYHHDTLMLPEGADIEVTFTNALGVVVTTEWNEQRTRLVDFTMPPTTDPEGWPQVAQDALERIGKVLDQWQQGDTLVGPVDVEDGLASLTDVGIGVVHHIR